jgi:biotin transport system substrate-specific component
MSTVSIVPRRSALFDRIVAPTITTDVLLTIVGAAFVGLLAQISWTVHPFVVPFTGQTLGVLVVGATYGLRRSIAAMTLYVVAGLAGVPWFANHAHGFAAVKPLLGYCLGFILAAAVMGALVAKGSDRTVTGAIGLFVLGELAIYAVGVPWLAYTFHQSLGWGITNGLVPYLVWDIAKAIVAGTLLPVAWRLVDRNA